MPCAPAVLLTDWLVYLLLAVIMGFGITALRREHLRAPWRQVKRRPLAMAALVVLAVYVVIGLLDSVHYRRYDAGAPVGTPHVCANEAISVLDALLGPLRERVEKTYSAPFALHAFSKETVEREDGSTARVYPRLEYGGAHLRQVDERAGDIARRVSVAVVQAGVVWVLLVLAGAGWRVRRESEGLWAALARLRRGDTETPWRSILLSIGLVLLGLVLAWKLALYYHIFGTDQVGTDVFYKSLKDLSVFRRYVGKFLAEYEMFKKNDIEDGDIYAELMEKYTGFSYRAETHLFDLVPEFYSLDYVISWMAEATMEKALARTVGHDWMFKSEAGKIFKDWWWCVTSTSLMNSL